MITVNAEAGNRIEPTDGEKGRSERRTETRVYLRLKIGRCGIVAVVFGIS